jgi:hypothetical protein
MIDSLRQSVRSAWSRLKTTKTAVERRVSSIPATVWVPAFAALIGALSAFVAVWAIRLYRRDTRPVYDVD